MIKYKLKKRGKAILLCLLLFIPYPSKIFPPFQVVIMGESERSLSNIEGALIYTNFPSIRSFEKIISFNTQGVAFIDEENVWMPAFVRISYKFFSIVLRGGWSDPSAKIVISLPHKELTRYAILCQPVLNEKQKSFSDDGNNTAIRYIDSNSKIWHIWTERSILKDSFRVYIPDARKLTDLKIKLADGKE